MKRNLLAGFIAAISASGAFAGEAVFYVTEQGQPVDTLSITVNGDRKLVGKNGFATFELGGGTHQVELSEFGQWAGEFEFDADAQQNAEIQVEMIGGEAVPEISVYTPGQEEAPAYGQISGYIESDETGGGVEGATITVAGSDLVAQTDGEGYYELELPRGEYDLSIEHPTYGARDIRDLRVIGNYATAMNVNMSMSGDSAIEEVVAVGSYIPSTATAQQRDSSAVLNSIGAEQFERYGDSSAASALKRVAGVTLADGKFAVVRGLNERYTTVTLNGAALPSPDPARRVVPLDIFPSSVVKSLDVQKSATPDTPANSAGGLVALNTKSAPDFFEGKVSASLGVNDAITFEDRQVQDSQSGDFFGFGASDRALPSSVKNLDFDAASPAQLESAAKDMKYDHLALKEKSLNPDVGIEASVGNTLALSDMDFGYNLSLKYDNSWNHEDSDRAEYRVTSGDAITANSTTDFSRTVNDVTLGLAGAFNLVANEANDFGLNVMMLRQSQADSRSELTVGGDQSRDKFTTGISYGEREFLISQLFGSHIFDIGFYTVADWNLSLSEATLDDPDRLEYSYERDEGSNNDPVLFLSTFDRRFTLVEDSANSFNLDLKSELVVADSWELSAKYGLAVSSRERDAAAKRIGYSWNGASSFRNEDFANESIETLFPDYLGSNNEGVLYLQNNTVLSDSYSATSDLTAFYLGFDSKVYELANFDFGVRVEQSSIEVDSQTADILIPSTKTVEDDAVLPSLNVTWLFGEESQLRTSYYAARNRPDFRELSSAVFYDPISGDEFEGDPDAVEVAEINNFDLRYEYYWSDSESASIGVFYKDFTSPIEKTIKAKGGDAGSFFSFKSAETGYAQGLELELKKSIEFNASSIFVAGNLSLIDTEVDLGNSDPGDTGTREMQGQPKSLLNIQLGYDDLNNASEYTLVMNRQGETLYSVGLEANGVKLPNIIQEPRIQLDFNYKYALSDEFKLKASIKNIVDDPYELTQGGNTYRSYDAGREYSFGVSYTFY